MKGKKATQHAQLASVQVSSGWGCVRGEDVGLYLKVTSFHTSTTTKNKTKNCLLKKGKGVLKKYILKKLLHGISVNPSELDNHNTFFFKDDAHFYMPFINALAQM